MSDLTLAQRFGDDVTFNATTMELTIDLNNLNNIVNGGVNVGLDVSEMTDDNKDSYSSRIFWALLQLQLQNQAENNNDETVGVYLTNSGRRNITRNQINQIGFQLTTTGYINDSLGVTLDPDSIGA